MTEVVAGKGSSLRRHRFGRDRIPVQSSKNHLSFECQHEGHLLCADPACCCWHHDEAAERLATDEERTAP